MIEDDRIINEGVVEFLNAYGHEARGALSLKEAKECLLDERFEVILLDILMGDGSGLDFLNCIKEKHHLPVIMLTALDDELTQVKAFDNLCDDYISKPFSLILLEKRLRAVHRRFYNRKSTWNYQEVEVDFEGYEASRQGKPVELTAKEFALLKYLCDHEDLVLTRGQLLDGIWSHEDEEPFERIIDVYVKNLRKN